MNILHIAPNAPYNEGWGYQENLLPKYQKKLGHDVTLIITNTMHRDGKIVETDCEDYISKDGVRVIRLKHRQYFHRALTNWCSELVVHKYLMEIQPDYIFFHGLVSTSIFDVAKYKKTHHHCLIVQDNHLDYFNCGACKSLKSKICRTFHRWHTKKTIDLVDRVYGVTPWRQRFAEEYFKISPKKTDVLMMGADDENIRFERKDKIRNQIRDQYRVLENDFLIVTGGKIDPDKKTLELMSACADSENVKLMVFGNVSEQVREEFEKRVDNKNIIYIGWIGSEQVYDYFFAADLVAFPGSHSVMWEQACASKVPCLFKRWDGMQHVNNGGNSDFIDEVTVDSLKEKIQELKFTPKYDEMLSVARSEKTDVFLYSKIAEKSLEMMTHYEATI